MILNFATEQETLMTMELQEDINKLVELANKWQMNFNVDKCSMIHIGHNSMQSNYNMSNQQLHKQNKWHKQTKKNCKTASSVLGFIPRNFRNKNKELILPLCKSLVRPHLEHAVQFWSQHLRRDNDKMDKI